MKEKILKLRDEGNTYNQIVEILGCAKSTVSYYCSKGSSKNWKKYTYPEGELREAIKNSKSIRQVCIFLNLPVSGGRYETLKAKIEEYGIDCSHFSGQSWAKGETGLSFDKEEFVDRVLKIGGSGWRSHTIKLKLYELGIKNEECEECGVASVWNNKPISLHLDHINGNNKDNRLENLRVLCPNCHSQTDTYAGKNIGSYGGMVDTSVLETDAKA